ncbi:hypothetical protein [Janthinobacterium sp. RB2R34]|uniref:hypothetical protein n=1 Tax=Janthinobacterium sp. RB2R34 TaxID=3424193 RepID=UPI003F263F1D
MSAEQILEKILERLATVPVLTPTQPISIALWDTKDIAAYLHRSQDRVYSDIVCLPTFPKPIRLPVKGRAQALYKAREVIAWTEKHQS